jgi:DNA-binding MarR family transcriptional regulator
VDDDATRKPTHSADAIDLSGLVRATIGRLYRRFRSERVDGALGDTALEVLTYLEKNGPHTLTQLSELGHVAPASMSQSVNRLTSGGYAVRLPDPNDRRRVLFRPTTEGTELALATRTQRNAWLELQIQQLSPRDQSTLVRACELLGNIADS